MIIVLVVMLAIMGLSAGLAVIVGIFAAVCISKPSTREVGWRALFFGFCGIVVTDALVVIARTNPSIVDQLPHLVQRVLFPLIVTFVMPQPIFALIASTCFGFGCAGGLVMMIGMIQLKK